MLTYPFFFFLKMYAKNNDIKYVHNITYMYSLNNIISIIIILVLANKS